ncbi:solute:sodium symporter family transporter [Algimonas ampicilliniresistens]|uniref:Solute:sodium symporter family transporter n=1 Tax=Algimonas ampicilliniresistens TaxID=1298735 RepID=A0ABQ5V497_9PROT|nr:SLC5 family protein [Algimonas ampicilliniresistens]GLQ22351.1 solute:sodium symporter family transporter [Algimonas ampicilliniresistens]
MELSLTQVLVFLGLSAAIALATWWFCRDQIGRGTGESAESDYFLAGGGLKWYFVAGSITLTNLSTDQLVGMNGAQMALLAWWELAAVVGLMMLAFVFIPVYYKYNCTTTTELLERRYNNKHIRALISILFLLGNIFIFLPAILYGGSLFMINLFDLDINLYIIAALFAIVGSAYAIFGGLRAVAVSDTFSGVLLLGLAILVTVIALNAIGWDLSGIPRERLTLIGGPDSDIPFTTLFTGMLFIQMFYWSTNQTITQRAMASPSVGEAQKGILAAAAIRLLIIPPIIVLPGIVAFKLYGDIGDATYGRLVGDVLPAFLSGAFAAAIAAAVLTTFNSILNASAALWVMDIHETYINKRPNVRRLSLWVSVVMVLLGFALIPIFNNPENSIIDLVQRLYGLLSMPILSAFIVGLLFRNVNAYAMIVAVLYGVLAYGWATNPFGEPNIGLHYIHIMAITLFSGVALALLLSLLFGSRPVWDAHNVFSRSSEAMTPIDG